MNEPEIPGSIDGIADWDGQPVVVTLIKTSAIFGNQPEGARYLVAGRPGLSRSEVKRQAFRMLERSLPDENTSEWEDEQRVLNPGDEASE